MKPPTKDEARVAAGSGEAAKRDELQAEYTAPPTPPAGTALTATGTALTVTAAAIHAEHEAAQRCASEAVAHAIRAGELLIEAKVALAHGAFGPWLAANVEFSDRTARGYMRLAGLDGAKRQRVADLSLREAMTAIADKRDAPEVFEQVKAGKVALKEAAKKARPAKVETTKAPKPESKCISVKDHVDDCRAYIAKHFLSIESREDRGEFLKRVNAILRQYAGEINKEAREARKPDREADDASKPAKTGKTNKVLKDVEARLNAMFNNRGAEQ